MADGNYGTLSITINADSKQANSSIKQLSASLKSLDKTSKELDTKKVTEVRGLLQSIAKIDFSNVSKGLQDVVSAFKALSKQSAKDVAGKSKGKGVELESSYPMGTDIFTQMNDIKSIDFSPVTTQFDDLIKEYQEANKVVVDFDKAVQQLQDDMEHESSFVGQLEAIGLNGKQIQAIFDALNKDFSSDIFNADQLTATRQLLESLGVEGERLVNVMNSLKTEAEEVVNPFSAMGFNGRQVADIMKAINYETNEFNADEIKRLEQGLKSMGYSADAVKGIVDKLQKSMNNLDKGAKKGASGLKKIANQFKNIMKYRIIRKIIQELYKALTEGITNIASFDAGMQDSLSRLTSAFTYIKNSLGAMLSPLIQIVTPILEMVMKLVGDLGNTFAEMFSSMSGQSQVAQATYELEEYNKEAKKTQSLGIDELNVLSPEQSSGGFEYKQTENVTNAFGEAFGKLKEILAPLIDTIKYVVQTLRPVLEAIGTLLNGLMPVINVIIGIINLIIGKTAESVNNSIASLITMLGKVFNLIGTILEKLFPIIEVIIHLFNDLLNFFNDSLIIVFDFIGQLADVLTDLVNIIFSVLSPILRLITNLLHVIMNVVSTVIKTLNTIGSGVLTIICNVLKAIEPLLEFIANGLGANLDKQPVWKRVLLGILSGGGSELLGLINRWGNSQGSAYASGGFPEDGLFLANHNELVGQFSNGQTAVANNEQITQGIYLAVLQAMRDSGGESRTISIQIDGKEIAKAVNKQNAKAGYEGINGGYKYGY